MRYRQCKRQYRGHDGVRDTWSPGLAFLRADAFIAFVGDSCLVPPPRPQKLSPAFTLSIGGMMV